MAEILVQAGLTQGTSNAVSDLVFASFTGINGDLTSAGSNLPTLADDEFFEVRDHPLVENNGLYRVNDATPAASAVTVEKVTGDDPTNDATGRACTLLGDSTTPKNVFYDTLNLGYMLIKQNGLSDDGVIGSAVYSAAMRDTKTDTFLELNMPMPLLAIDNDAGKYIWGQDASGNFNGYRPVDNATFGINTTKLIRSAGWTEFDVNGNTTFIRAGIVSQGTVEDPANDITDYVFGDPRDQSVDSIVAFDFPDAVNEAIPVYERLADGTINGGTGVAIGSNGRTLTVNVGDWTTMGTELGFEVGGAIGIRDAENSTSNTGTANRFRITALTATILTAGTPAAPTATEGFDFTDGGAGDDSIDRNDGGDWIQEGYFVGGTITSSGSEGALNNFTATITSITATSIGVPTATVAAATDDNTAEFGPFDSTGTPDTVMNAAIDQRNGIELFNRIRDADPQGKTFGVANLASAGETVLDGRKFVFVLGNTTDTKIDIADASIGGAPHSGITVEYFSTPQSFGGGGGDALTGGARNFGIEITGNGGTSQEIYEKVHYLLRQSADMDTGAGTVIGVMADDLCRFVGDNFRVGEFIDAAAGPRFPVNPLGGGSGVFVSGMSAASKNTTTVIDNLGVDRNFPVGTPYTLDFNSFLEGDPGPARFAMIFEYTIRTTVPDLIITAGTGSSGTFDSAGANLPAAMDVDPNGYVRVSGKTGADILMNGVYQVTATTSSSQWAVTRVDANTIVTTGASSCTVDEHAYETPDALIVQDNVPTDIAGSAASDDTGTIDYSGNTQGGRTGGTDLSVFVRAQGTTDAQYTLTGPTIIGSGTAVTIVVNPSEERNYV